MDIIHYGFFSALHNAFVFKITLSYSIVEEGVIWGGGDDFSWNFQNGRGVKIKWHGGTFEIFSFEMAKELLINWEQF